MSTNSATAVSLTRQDARVLGRALHREGAFESRSTVNDRLIAEVERMRSADSAAVAEGPEKPARPKASGSRRSKRTTARPKATRTATAAKATQTAKSSRASKATTSRPRKQKAAPTPNVTGVPAILDRVLAAFNGALDWLFGLHGLAKGAMIALASAGVLFLFFYQPAANLWAAHRDHDQLLAEQQALAEVSDELEERIAELRTEEGIMDEARIRGYAPAGEIAADASELVGEEDVGIIAVLGQAPEETEDSPLTQALDVFFGYQKRA